MNTVEKVLQSKAVILRMYTDESDQRDWAVAYSGGKDSTAVAGLVVSVIESLPKEKRWRRVHLVMADTKMENPLVHSHMVKQCDLVNKYAKEKELPIGCTIVSRPKEHSYFYLTLGKGYPLPYNNGSNRWCTERLKIKPNATHLKEINPSYILTGVRHAESQSRSRNIDKMTIDEFIAKHPFLTETLTLNPIIYWTIEDVWKFLEMEGLPWGSTLSVRTIYRDATGECGFTNPVGVEQKSVEVCGARHGCWNCPVILNDKSTEKMSEKHEWLEPLTYWRMLQLKVYGNFKPEKIEGEKRPQRSARLREWESKMEEVKKITRAGHMRNGKKIKEGQGTLTLEARKFLLSELLLTEKTVNRLRKQYGLPEEKLISDEEVQMIHEMWKQDEQLPYLIGQPLTSILELIE